MTGMLVAKALVTGAMIGCAKALRYGCLENLVGRRLAVSSIAWLGDVFILHHRNNPAPLNGRFCALVSAHPTYCCRADSMYRQSDCRPRRKGSCLGWCHW